MYMTTNDEESRCTCTVGVGSRCSVHYDEPTPEVIFHETLNDYDFSSMYHHIQPLITDIESKKVRTIKVRWIESTTEKSVLVMTKKQKWFWIPISVISDLNRTSKGNWKIVVYDYFKEKEIVVKNHHYFERDEYL
mgnify:FL=1